MSAQRLQSKVVSKKKTPIYKLYNIREGNYMGKKISEDQAEPDTENNLFESEGSCLSFNENK